MSKTEGLKKHYFYQARCVAQQTNAAGGVIKVRISPATGSVLRVVDVRITNSGNNGAEILKLDEDNQETIYFAGVSAAAAAKASIPQSSSQGATSTALVESASGMIAQGQKLELRNTAAGVQNDTLTIHVLLEIIGVVTAPTWDKDASTNAADVTLATSTISTTNTLFKVRA